MGSINTLYCIVVMYNQECNTSKTCSFLERFNSYNFNLQIIIVDNSTILTTNEKYCKIHDWNYINMNGNSGISKAYNRAISTINNLDCWIVFWDQDTIIPEGYFNEAIKSINNNPELLIHVPIVKDSIGILSPSYMKRYNVKRLRTINEITNFPRYITAINTGMIVSRQVFIEKMRYNENLFLDYVDHDFIREFRKIFGNIKIFDCILTQNFSDNSHEDITSDISRFKIYLKDFKFFCWDSIQGKVFFGLKIVYRAIKLSYLYKNLIFIKILFS